MPSARLRRRTQIALYEQDATHRARGRCGAGAMPDVGPEVGARRVVPDVRVVAGARRDVMTANESSRYALAVVLLLYISHANVTIERDVPVPRWHLSDVGRERVHRMLGQPWVMSLSGS